jgi:hypothetical protein
MAILDYIPNIFGGAPTMYQGLLNPQDQAALQQRANLGGLLGFGAALAQGMSPQGYRRSAAENILTALGAGFGGAGQTYESGINQLANVQKLQQSRLQIDAINQVLADPNVDPQIKALIRIDPASGIKYLMENAPLMRILGKPRAEPRVEPRTQPIVEPRVAPRAVEAAPPVVSQPVERLTTTVSEPVEVVRTPPPEIPAGESDFVNWRDQVRAEAAGKTPEQINDAARIALAETNAALAANQPSGVVTTPSGRLPEGASIEFNPIPIQELSNIVKEAAPKPEPVPAPVSVSTATPVVATNELTRLNSRKNQLLDENEELSRLPTKRADELIERNSKQIETLDKQINRLSVSQFNFSGVENLVPPQFKSRVANLREAAKEGTLTMDQLTQRLQTIEKDAIEFVTKRTDYTNQDRRVAASMFRNPDGTSKAIEELEPAELMQLENKLFDLDIQKRRAGATTINMPSESERTAGFLTNRVVNAVNQLQTVVKTNPTAASPKFSSEVIRSLSGSDTLKNLVNPESRQQVEAAQLEILDAALTLGTGAAYTREQLENYRRSFFPQLGDKPATIKDKQDRLKSLIDSAMIKSGRAAPGMPSGMNAPAFDANAIQMELDRRKGK